MAPPTKTCTVCGKTYSKRHNYVERQWARQKRCSAACRPSFDARLRKDTVTGCLLWIAGCNDKGYGRARLGGKSIYAHRHAWERTFGPVPDGLCVLHKCDIRRCCNPEHLFLGTPQDNSSDMVAKGRGPLGEKAGSAKLTSMAVRVMFRLREMGFLQRELAEIWGVSAAHVCSILSGKFWPHVKLARESRQH